MVDGWQAIALNTAPDSANEIHGDRIAKQYGFQGGLVPGVTISAYLIHPAVAAWGMQFLDRGHAHVRVGSPLYDGESFEVRITDRQATSYKAELIKPDGTVSAEGEAGIADAPPIAPSRWGDPVAEKGFVCPAASVASFTTLKEDGCLAFRYRWGAKHGMRHYVLDESLMPGIHQGQQPWANMGYLLGISNWVLAGNAHMNPWVHLETWSQNYCAVAWDTSIIAEMSVLDLYEKKGHEFVDVDVALFDEETDNCLSTIRLRAIYRLRGL